MDERTRFRRFVAVISVVLVLGALFIIVKITAGIDNEWTIVSAAILLSMALVVIAVTRRGLKDLESGIPIEDERSRTIKIRAGYLAFFTSLFFIMGMGFVHAILEDDQISSLPTSEWLMIYVGIMGTIYLIILAYMKRKGVSR